MICIKQELQNLEVDEAAWCIGHVTGFDLVGDSPSPSPCPAGQMAAVSQQGVNYLAISDIPWKGNR